MKRKILFKRIAIFGITLSLAGCGAFMMTPNRTKTVQLPSSSSTTPIDVDDPDTYFSRFVTHMKNAADTESEESISALKATLEGFYVSWGEGSVPGTAKNTVSVDGDLFLSMNSISDVQFTTDLKVTYNQEDIDLALGYVDGDMYIALEDLKIKSTGTSQETMVETLRNMFFDSENPDGLGLTVNIDEIVNSFLDGFDLGALLNSFSGESEESVNFKVEEGSKDSNGLILDTITVFKQDKEGQITSNILDLSLVLDASDEDNIFLSNLQINSLAFNDVSAGGKIVFDNSSSVKVLGLDDPNYQGRVKRTGFKEAFSYIGYADRLLNLLKSRTAGLRANVSLRDLSTNDLYADINLKVDVDASSLLPSWQGVVVAEKIKEMQQKENVTKGVNDNEESLTDKILNELAFGLDISVSGKNVDEEYANLGIHYKDQVGYLTLNEGSEVVNNNVVDNTVMRACIDTATVQKVIEKVPTMMEAVMGEENEEKASDLFNAITDSKVVKGIKDGDYSSIIGLLDSISNDDDKIVLSLKLNDLGLGNNSRVVITLDSNSENEILNITCSDIELASLKLDLTLESADFSADRINAVVANKDKYDNLHYLPSVFDQVTAILQSKKAGFALTGSYTDAQGLGLDISGWGQFDYGVKYGYGNLTINEYKELKNGSPKLYTSHILALDVDNKNANLANNNLRFTYGANKGIKGRMTIESLSQIMDVVSLFIEDNKEDERFTKFVDPLMDLLGFSYLGEMLDTKDYAKLASNTLIRKIKESASGDSVSITIAGSVMSLDNDLVININFAGQGENRTIKSLSVPGLVYNGKTIRLTLEIKEFDDNKLSPVNVNDNFINFSSLKMLLDFGLNTTKQGYYHLNADINMKLIGLDLIKFKLDFYVQVKGSETKVYGLVPKLPTATLLGYAVFNSNNANSQTEFVFEPNRAASGNDIGGYFHILRTEKFSGGLFSSAHTDKYYFRSDSKNFVDAGNKASNLIYYIVTDMLNIKATYSNLINSEIAKGSDDSKIDDPKEYENIFKDGGYSYSHQSGSKDHNFNIGINLEALTNSNVLDVLTLDLTATENAQGKGYLSKASVHTSILSVVIIVDADIKLLNAGSSATDWNADGIDSKYNNVVNVYNKICNAGKKADFDNNYFNNPKAAYNVSKIA